MTAALYQRAWEDERYRVKSPGAELAERFVKIAKPKLGQTVRDLGCGTGRGGAVLAAYGLDVTLYDWAENCRDAEVTLPFVRHDLRQPVPGPPADWGYCCDVLEHIEPADVPAVLVNVCRAARQVFLAISSMPDHAGPIMFGEPLHLTVKPHDWWKERLEAIECEVLWSDDADGKACAFLVTAFASGKDFISKSTINTDEEQIKANIRANLAAGYEEVRPHRTQDLEVMVLGGGPSLNDFEDEIRERRATGMRLVTVNGTYNWCLERGITPSVQIVCDAREFNRRFVEPAVPRCRYLIASQCDPALPASLPRDQVLLWHSGEAYGVPAELGLERWKQWCPITGGGTVILRSIPLLRILGFARMHFYGLDSCLRDGAHHAYAQPENDRGLEVDVTVGGRTFVCNPWMVCQAEDFKTLAQVMGDTVELAVHGDGLIAHLLTTAATLEN